MDWLELIVETDASHRERVESVLEQCGAQALTLNDAGNEPVLEPLPGEMPMWSQVRITALFNGDANCSDIDTQIKTGLPGFFAQWRRLKNQQWERVWLERFKPKQFGNKLWIIPGGFAPVDEQATNILMDPGLAFGTGDHPTTDLCLQWLDHVNVAGLRVLDYGHGSGVLGIAAALLGARDVVGVDIDPQAIIAGNNNAKVNHVTEKIVFTQIAPKREFDVLIANILAAPLIAMAKKLSNSLKFGGKIALSGILKEQAEDVQRAFKPWITWQALHTLDDWVLICGERTNPKHHVAKA